uniref:E3 ubiquitin-protein ligase listerin n=5 Tax=Hirondellea gigas TaxID=1518452 RepID=A0A6A7FU61_9CRUS
MGKDKHAQRTKGNQKPSSSVRSAELLGGIGNNSVGFLGFGMGANAPSSLLPNDNCVTQDFRLALRKMAKKDAITKIKALQEFDELIKSEDMSSIKTALPFWPRLYCKLSLDIEKKVRESAQVCHGHLALKVSKLLAPYLCSLVPCWLLAMCDPYIAAASAATHAFQNVFSEDKRPGVLFHCSKEVVDYITDNLFRQTADTLSDPKTTTPVEREDKYIRVVCSTLESISLLLRLTQSHPGYETQLLPLVTNLLHEPQFWKIHKHPSPKVRSLFYHCVSEVTSSSACDIPAACQAVRAGLCDVDAAVLPPAYTALLHLAHKHPLCWEELGCSSKKPVTERLLRLMSDGCRGVATDVAPLLLPLLAVIPHSALTQPAEFYSKLLQAIANNVLRCEIFKSQQEVAVLQQTLFECVRLLSKDATLDRDFWHNVITNMIGEVIQLAIRTTRQLDSCATFESVVSLSLFWTRRAVKQFANSSTDEGVGITASSATSNDNSIAINTANSPCRVSEDSDSKDTDKVNADDHDSKDTDISKSDDCVNTSRTSLISIPSKTEAVSANFTQDLNDILWNVCFTQCILALEDPNRFQLQQICLLLRIIQNPKSHTNSKKSGVKFAPSVTKSPTDIIYNTSNTSILTDERDQSSQGGDREVFNSQFQNCVDSVSKLVTDSYKLYKNGESDLKINYLKLFAELLTVFEEFEPYGGLLKDYETSGDDGESCYMFVLHVLVPELEHCDYGVQCVLAQVLQSHLLRLMPGQQMLVMEAILRTSSVEALRAVLEKQQQHKGQLPDSVRAWLSSAPLGARLVRLLKEALALTIALAYERQDIANEERRRRARGKQRREDCSGEELEEESVLVAHNQRQHLVALVQMVLAAEVSPHNASPVQAFQFSSNYISQILVVLHTSLPTELHVLHHEDSASSTVSNVELVVQLATTVFSSNDCWHLQHTYRLLHSLFLMLCPEDLILALSSSSQKNDDEESQKELHSHVDQSIVLENTILPPRVADALRDLVFLAFSKLVAFVVRDEQSKKTSTEDQSVKESGNVNIGVEYNKCLKGIFEHIILLVGNQRCSYGSALYLAELSNELLMIISNEGTGVDDCDLPLDCDRVREAFDLLLPSEGCWAQWEALMSPIYLAPTVLLGPYNFRRCPLPRNMREAISWDDSYTRAAVFLSTVLARISTPKHLPSTTTAATPHTTATSSGGSEAVDAGVDSTSSTTVHGGVQRLLDIMEGYHITKNNEEDDSSSCPNQLTDDQIMNEQISLGPYIRLACVCVHASYYLETMVQLSHALNLQQSTASSLDSVVETLSENTSTLIARVNRGNLQQVSKVVRDLAAGSETGLWCVTLMRLLADYKKHINVDKLMDGLDLQAFNATAVRQVLLEYLPTTIGVSTLLETEVSRLSTLTDDPFSGVDVLSVVASLLARGPAPVPVVHAVMDIILHWWKHADSVFLFAADVSVNSITADDLTVVLCVVRALRALLKHHVTQLTALHWERLLCATTSWVQSLQDSSQSLEQDSLLGSFVCAVASLVATIENIMQNLNDKAGAAIRDRLPEKLQQEWQEFFSSFLHTTLLTLYVKVEGWYRSGSGRSVLQYCVCRDLCRYAATVPVRDLIQHTLPPLHHQEDIDQQQNLPDNIQVLLNHLCEGLLSPHPSVSGCSHKLLQRVMPEVMKEWCSSGSMVIHKNAEGDVDDGQQLQQRSLPPVLIRLIKQCGPVVSTALDERSVLGGWCVVVPHTDSHTYTVAYCLAWHIVFLALQYCDENAMHDYAAGLKSPELLPQLLTVLMRLLPPEHSFPVPPASCRCNSCVSGNNNMINTSLSHLSPNQCASSYVVWWASSQLFLQSMKLFPYWVRNWYNTQSKKNSDLISTYTTKHFSPVVINEELGAIIDYKSPDDNVKVKVRSQREVIATYTIDDSQLVLTLQLPANLPLAPAVMVHSEHAGVSPKLWEGWKNGLKTVLSYRNSPLLASLKVWKQNLDQKYQGVEPCYICYCIMHNNNHTLPSSQCRTCKKKFHSACLYQWFLTSPHSNCPLCRSVW